MQTNFGALKSFLRRGHPPARRNQLNRRRLLMQPQPLQGAPVVNEASMVGIPWVWRGVSMTANAIAQAHVAPLKGSKLAEFWSEPTDDPGVTGFHLLQGVAWDLQVHGNAYWIKPDGRSDIVVPVEPEWVHPRREIDGRLTYYADGLNYPAEQIVHFRGPAGSAYDQGNSPVKLLTRQFAMEILQRGHVYETLLQGGFGAGYWTTDIPSVSPEDVETWAEYIRDNIGGTQKVSALVTGILRFNTFALSMKDLQMIEARQFSATETAAALGIPVSLLDTPQMGTSHTYKNLESDLVRYDRTTLSPLARSITETIATHFAPIEFDFSEFIEPPMKELWATVGKGYQDGLITQNEGRKRIGFDEVDGGDEFMAAPTMTEEPPAPVEDDPSAIVDMPATEPVGASNNGSG